MLILGPGQQGVQSMAKLMNQCGSIAVAQHAIGLLKVEGQGHHRSLVLPFTWLTASSQGEMSSMCKFALPASMSLQVGVNTLFGMT